MVTEKHSSKMLLLPAQERILVTGGSGFIGTNLVGALLRQGISVSSLDIAPPRDEALRDVHIPGDILDLMRLRTVLNSFRPTIVIHLAARTDLDHRAHLDGYAANTEGVSNMIEAIAETKSVRHTIFASTKLVCPQEYCPSSMDEY